MLTPHNFSAKESFTNLTPSAFLFTFMRNDCRVPFCDSANHKTTTMTIKTSLKPPLQVREIDSFAEVSNRDIVPFIAAILKEGFAQGGGRGLVIGDKGCTHFALKSGLTPSNNNAPHE